MKRLLIAASFIAVSSSASFALEPGCNPAIQNWLKGSHDTCPVADGGASVSVIVREYNKGRRHHCEWGDDGYHYGEDSRSDK